MYCHLITTTEFIGFLYGGFHDFSYVLRRHKYHVNKSSLRTELIMFAVIENNFNETLKHFKVRPFLFLIPPG